MQSFDLRKKFLDFFEKQGHKIIPSSPLLPPDKSVLFTTAGMQQLSPYLEGKKDPIKDFGSRHLCDVQKCFRTNDIEQVGDDTHHTFFEMLGNWSIGVDEKGEYFKEGAIKYALEFLVDELGLDKSKMWATIFKGEGDIPKDLEALELWQKYGIPKERIAECDMENNFWGPTAVVGPCGPCSEIHYDRGENYGCGKKDCAPNCPDCNRFVEVWNLVFMQYRKAEAGKFIKLDQTNIDTGTGFERLLCILNKTQSAYETDLFEDILAELKKISKADSVRNKKEIRIIADHIRGACFLIGDGIMPSNVGQGYVLRRILRRAMRYGQALGALEGFLIPLAKAVIEKYKAIYPELGKEEEIISAISNEEEKFYKILENGVREFCIEFPNKNDPDTSKAMIGRLKGIISAERSFYYHQSLGLTIEVQRDLARENGYEIDEVGFIERMKQHQEISRAGAQKLFGGHGAQDIQSEEDKYKVVKLHTATHLLQAALRQILGSGVSQQGSNITPERLRFDFSFDRKMTQDEIRQVEDLVNEKIKENLEVIIREMPYKEAIESGALAFFKEKYPEKVSVYSIGSFSNELCGGPHVKRAEELGHFKIIKEEASSAGVRRIKARLE